MQFVAVLDVEGSPLMPCSSARARQLLSKGKAVAKHIKGLFCIQKVIKTTSAVQKIVVGIDPGSKKEGFTVKSKHHTYLNINADAVTWVKKHKETQKQLRISRRYRKIPCRANRKNRSRGGIPPSTKARWQWKLRVVNWLSRLYPIASFVVEDIVTETKEGKRRWNASFSPLEVGKQWFYAELKKQGEVTLVKGQETANLRKALGLLKIKEKLKEVFEAHCIDSWVLANQVVGGHPVPDNKDLLCITPLQFHRRELHRQNYQKGHKRPGYGGTLSHGFKRGSLANHPKYGIVQLGGFLKDKISLNSTVTGKRLTQQAKVSEITLLTTTTWRMRFLPALKDGVSSHKT